PRPGVGASGRAGSPPGGGGGGGGGGPGCDDAACGEPPSAAALGGVADAFASASLALRTPAEGRLCSPRTRGEVTPGAAACPVGDVTTVAGTGASARCSITVPWSSPASGSFHSKASSRPLTGEIGSQ